MARRKNLNCTGHAHELTFTCYRNFPLLAKDRTRNWLATAINETNASQRVDLYAYVFMPDHVHLLVHPREGSHDIAMYRKAIKAPVGRRAIAHLREHAPDWLHHLTRTRGSRTEQLFWQSGGGYDRNVVEAKTLEKMVTYIHQNPVRRGLATSAADWHWSSAAWYASKTPGPCRVHPIPYGL